MLIGTINIVLLLYVINLSFWVQARRKVAEELGTVVRWRRKESESGEKKKDMLGALLAGEDALSDEQIVDFLLALLVAGYETTSTTMTLAVKFLTEMPLALAQLQVIFRPPYLIFFLKQIIIKLKEKVMIK